MRKFKQSRMHEVRTREDTHPIVAITHNDTLRVFTVAPIGIRTCEHMDMLADQPF